MTAASKVKISIDFSKSYYCNRAGRAFDRFFKYTHCNTFTTVIFLNNFDEPLSPALKCKKREREGHNVY